MMQSIPALVQVLVIFTLVVLATTRKVHLGLAAALGGMGLGLWRGIAPATILGSTVMELLKADTLLLLVLITGIMAFSAAMKKSGGMNAFSKALEDITPSSRIAMATAPLLIGTLPMPGGAILSAPLVDAMDPGRTRGGETLSAANYWFRHNLELVWPLYPAFVLSASITGFSVGRLMMLNAYSTPILFVLGLVFILPRLRSGSAPVAVGRSERPGFASRLAIFGHSVMPLALLLGSYVIVDILWRYASPALSLDDSARAVLDRYLPILSGIVVGSSYIGFGPAGFGAFKGSVNMNTLRLVAVVAGIRIFSSLIGVAGVAGAAAGELAAAGIPAVVAVAALPFVAALVTGIGFGYVGLAFPIVLGLVPEGGTFPREAAIVLAGAFGFAGMMLSPLHVCMVVSAEHFGAGIIATIRRFAAPLGIFLSIAMAYVWILSTALR